VSLVRWQPSRIFADQNCPTSDGKGAARSLQHESVNASLSRPRSSQERSGREASNHFRPWPLCRAHLQSASRVVNSRASKAVPTVATVPRVAVINAGRQRNVTGIVPRTYVTITRIRVTVGVSTTAVSPIGTYITCVRPTIPAPTSAIPAPRSIAATIVTPRGSIGGRGSADRAGPNEGEQCSRQRRDCDRNF